MSGAPRHPKIDLRIVGCPLCDGQGHRLERRLRGYDPVRCLGCGMVYVNPEPPAEALARGYAVRE